MKQLGLNYAPSHLGQQAWQRLLAALRGAIDHLGLKEVAFELDVSPSMLCDSLNERERKRFAAEWIPVVMLMSPTAMQTAILEALAALTPFKLEKRRKMTPEEENRALRAHLRREAPGALRSFDEEVDDS